MGFKRPEVRIFSPRPLKIGNHYDFRFFLCQNIFSESFQKPPIFQFRGSNFSTFCFYGKRKNSKELNDCSIKNRVKRHEKTFSLLVHTSSGQDPPIFSAANRLSTCVRHSRGLPARSFITPRRRALLSSVQLACRTGLEPFSAISVQSFSEEKRNSEGFCPAYV